MAEETYRESNENMAPNRAEAFNHVHNSIQNLHTGISSALDFTAAQNQFSTHVESIKQKEQKLRETVRKLELTKGTLADEMLVRESEELKLNRMIDELTSQRRTIETRISEHEQEVKGIKVEKEKLDALLARMKNVLTEMSEKIREFSEITKTEAS